MWIPACKRPTNVHGTLRSALRPHLMLGVLALPLLSAPATAAYTNLVCIADSFIIARSPDFNAGGYSDVAAGRDGGVSNGTRRGLFQFDLSALPPGSVITSAAFRVSLVRQALFGDVDSTFSIHRLTESWTEGARSTSSGGDPALAGEVTWNSRQHGSALWTTAGGTFDAAPSAATFVSSPGSYVWTGTGLVANVQTWLDDAAQNHGVLLRSQSEGTTKTARRFGCRESAQAAILEVGYLPPAPPPPATFTAITAPDGDPGLAWTAVASARYDLLFTRDLAVTTAWHLAESDIPADPDGTNNWAEAPYAASLANPANTALFFQVASLPAAPPPLPLAFDLVASNLVSPVALTHAGDGSGRLFIAEQTGQIRIVDGAGTLLPAPFLDLSPLMATLTPFGSTNAGLNPSYDERGLLGLAFHPAYTTNGRFFVYYSSPKSAPGVDHESLLAAYTVSATNANLADPSSAQVLLRVDEPEFNHNGGTLAFGPDGFLYLALGDGGGGGDLHGAYGNAQNTGNLLGKVLRLDVDGPPPYAIPPDNPYAATPGADEIFAIGFRNPWKFSFDRAGSNALWVADVGQNLWEEINVVRRGGNYGWRILEGRHAYDPTVAATVGVDVATLDAPLHEYRHGPLGISIIGGAVYRGPLYPELVGRYVFGDFSTSFGSPDGALFYLEESRPGIWQRFPFELPGGARLARYVKGFGEDETGNLYLLSTTRLGPAGTSGDVRRLRKP